MLANPGVLRKPKSALPLIQCIGMRKYLLHNMVRMHFDWEEPTFVGETMTFYIKFRQNNGRPYPVCDKDIADLVVKVRQGASNIAAFTEICTEPDMFNIVTVKFKTRQAGRYRIDVHIGTLPITGSPHIHRFLPRQPDPNRTILVRESSIIVCRLGMPYPIMIEPRDEFGNVCVFDVNGKPVEGYEIQINQLGTSPDRHFPAEFCGDTSLEYDAARRQICLKVSFAKAGFYDASVRLNGTQLRNGNFGIIVLKSHVYGAVQKMVDSNRSTICYAAKLLGWKGERCTKPKTVQCFISSKQLTIKEYRFKFFPKSVITIMLYPSTKFYLNGPASEHEGYDSFILDDGIQRPVELVSDYCDTIAATLAKFLVKKVGGSEIFTKKREYFYQKIRELRYRNEYKPKTIKVKREKLLKSSLKATKRFSTANWSQKFEITFEGEEGVDRGGVSREWFELISAALFDAENGLFESFGESQRALVHPSKKPAASRDLKYYEFAGKIVGKCIYESAFGGRSRLFVRARFTRSFLAQIIGLRVHYKYFEMDDPDLYASKIKYILENDVEGMELFFAEEEYSKDGELINVIELIPHGRNVCVTNDTKDRYLDVLAQHRLANNSIRNKVNHFLKGLNELIPLKLLRIFNENELEFLWRGTEKYSAEDLRAHHDTHCNSAEFRKVLDWFWTAVSNFTQEEMARLLQFTTGCSQLPPGGFQQLNPRFLINTSATFGDLPTTHTCANELCLPFYECYDHFEKALLLAINEGTEGFEMT
ncbi:apoptosis-resistant E3 ubiquitin protein ligase 1-like [Trichogramma pretiosum]|uniref:apoptosis-resistant E3 ubiquitin protein ligase 1-like n=1 Tax=Trichogramma pretiosum TaxID=7493 RepID=UPI0006C9BAA6|nr:apoptosis-resistant E3 ubiquitin protein ligase 1-like [Trichogramma pretiosum]